MLLENLSMLQPGTTALEEIEKRYGPKLALCYQCKKCTSGCPVAYTMDIRPHQAMRLVRLGATERLLNSDAIWTCVGCYTCSTRCPQDVPVTEIIYSLKRTAMKRGLTPKRARVPAFLKAFAASVERHGRNREPEMLARYFLSTDPRAALKDVPMGLKMIRQGRLPLWGHRLRRWKAMRTIVRRVRRLGGPA